MIGSCNDVICSYSIGLSPQALSADNRCCDLLCDCVELVKPDGVFFDRPDNSLSLGIPLRITVRGR